MDQTAPGEIDPFSECSQSDAVREALKRLCDDPVRFSKLKATFDEAIAELERGEGKPLDFGEIKRKARELVAAREKSQSRHP
ncbi:MAG: hypothetical protein WD872_02095 [Pirellulaceae bacterium]